MDIIGQFGVGFYSAFMVADTITVTTKSTAKNRLGSGNRVDGYTVTEAERDGVVPTLSCTSRKTPRAKIILCFEGVQAHGTDPQILRLYSLPHSDGSDQASAQGSSPEDKPDTRMSRG